MTNDELKAVAATLTAKYHAFIADRREGLTINDFFVHVVFYLDDLLGP